jgi:hypothetical protein
VPAVHIVPDGEESGARVEHSEMKVPPPSDPWPGSTAYLLYDHLALVQDEAHERGGATLAIRATDKAFATLTLASRGALAERGTAPSALVRKAPSAEIASRR